QKFERDLQYNSQLSTDEFNYLKHGTVDPEGRARRETNKDLIGILVSHINENEEGFDVDVQHLVELNHEFREQIAARLGPSLNARIQAMPQETIEQKKAICDFVERTLEPFGLAVKVPNTPGLPGKLKTHPGSWPKIGRFMFEVYIDGKRKQPAYSDTLPELELTDANPTRQVEANVAETQWQDSVGP